MTVLVTGKKGPVNVNISYSNVWKYRKVGVPAQHTAVLSKEYKPEAGQRG